MKIILIPSAKTKMIAKKDCKGNTAFTVLNRGVSLTSNPDRVSETTPKKEMT